MCTIARPLALHHCSAMSLDALKAMRAAMKKEKEVVAQESGKKYVTKADLEASKLKRIRAEEEKERLEKVSALWSCIADHGALWGIGGIKRLRLCGFILAE